jgi:peptidoglycan/xylan/chitin deacetylase (PgdA/CDA1 family)
VPHTLSLTFDDGPDELWSPRVLGTLKRCRAAGTFFLICARVGETPEIARAIIESGSEVQLHCYRHIRHSDLSEIEIERDTHEALAALAQVGIRPSYWRTPWGVQTAATARVAERNRLRLVNWTIDTHDWRGDAAAEMLARACLQLHDGGIVLMHDALGPGALRTGCENTVELLPGLIAAARSAGLEVGPLSHRATLEHQRRHARPGEPAMIGREG